MSKLVVTALILLLSACVHREPAARDVANEEVSIQLHELLKKRSEKHISLESVRPAPNFEKYLLEQVKKNEFKNKLKIEERRFHVCQSGGSCGGGGSTLRCEGQRSSFLLDLVTVNPGRIQAGFETGSPVLEPDVIRDDIEIVRPGDTKHASFYQAFTLASEILKAWQGKSCRQNAFDDLLLVTIQKQLWQMPYIFTNFEFHSLQRYVLPPLKARCEVNTAILFLYHYGPIISLPIWKNLDVDTQAGLLIHEAFRQLQTQDSRLSDEQIQMLTGIIMTRSPGSYVGLERLLKGTSLHLSLSTSTRKKQLCAKPRICDTSKSEVEILTSFRPQTPQDMNDQMACLTSRHQHEKALAVNQDRRKLQDLLRELVQKKVLKTK